MECLEYLESVKSAGLKEGKLMKQKNRVGLVLSTLLYSELNNAKLLGQ